MKEKASGEGEGRVGWGAGSLAPMVQFSRTALAFRKRQKAGSDDVNSRRSAAPPEGGCTCERLTDVHGAVRINHPGLLGG